MRLVCVLLVAMISFAGCAHEQLPWPPPSDDVARINDAAYEENKYLRVEYVDPLMHKRETPEMKAVRIEAVDPDQISFRTRAGGIHAVPIELVKGVAVRDRERGALVGGTLGLAAAALMLTGSWLMNRARGDCDWGCGVKFGATVIAVDVGVGVLLGYIISGRRTFHFERAR